MSEPEYDWQTRRAADELARSWLAGKDDFDRRLEQLMRDRDADPSRSAAKARQYVSDVVTLFRERVAELETTLGAVPIVYAPILERHDNEVAVLRERLRRAEERAKLTHTEQVEDDKVKVTIGAASGWDVESLEELCYRLRAGGADDLTRVYPTVKEASAYLPFPNLMPWEPMRPKVIPPLEFDKPTFDTVPAKRGGHPPIVWILALLAVLLFIGVTGAVW